MARTGENIYKRKDGRWEARYIQSYNSEGKPKYRSVYGKSHKEAKLKRLQLIHEAMSGIGDQPATVTIFSDLVKSWLNNTKLRVKESTYARYYCQVQKHILPYLGKYQTWKITTEQIEQLVGQLLKSKKEGGSGLSPKTVEDILIVIKNIFKFAKCYTHLDLYRIKIKKEEKRPLTLTLRDQSKLNQYLIKDPNFIKLGILLSLHTGIRIGELCALRWEDIDLKEQTIHINKTLQRIQVSSEEYTLNKTKVIITSPKSTKSIRDIYIPIFLTVLLSKMKGKAGCYFLTGDNKCMEPRTLNNHFKRYLKQCDIPDYNFHSLRHTFATNYIESGFDVKSLSEILGHSNVNITLERYVHSSNKLKRNNLEKLVRASLFTPSKIPSTKYNFNS